MNKPFLIISFLVLTFLSGSTQDIFKLEIIEKDNKKGSIINYYADSSESTIQLKNFIHNLYNEGFLTANIDSTIIDSTSYIAFINKGSKYKWAYLRPGNLDFNSFREVEYKEKFFKGTPISLKNTNQFLNNILSYYENNGYPFASIKLDSITIDETDISASLFIEKNKRCRIDSIVVKGKSSISAKYLHNYIGIKPGDFYNESKIKDISVRIKEIPFIKEIRPFNVSFSKNYTKVILYLEDKSANQFDGIIGFVPSDDITKSVRFTGDLKLNLHNALKRGEVIDLNWRSVKENTQDLKTNFIYPFIFNTPYGIDYRFNLYKQDTTYLNTNNVIGIQYFLPNGNYLKVFLDNFKSALLYKEILTNATVLPPYADITKNIYGINLQSNRLNYKLNPSKGYFFDFSVGLGSKEIKKISDYEDLYTNMDLKSNQYQLILEFDKYFTLKPKNVIKTAIKSGYTGSDAVLFSNESYKIGGFKSLRGFDEESILATFYSIISIEYRYLFEENSNIQLFVDGAFYENNTINGYINDFPVGLGAGLSFETKAGIFSINYAIGKQMDNPIDLKSSKIHFGIVNVF